MRLTSEQHRAIVEAVRDVFGDDAVVRLFGSRVDDDERGGDIDLHIETGAPADELLDRELRLRTRLLRRLGERRIDVVVHGRDQAQRAIDVRAHRTGVRL